MDSPNDLIFTGTTTPRPPKPGHDLAAVKTYNYLRLGMLVAVVALAYSVVMEYRQPDVHCFLGSISGYYYTPVHPIFIGLMVTIGFTLIVIKGRTPWEDGFLILAGLMAPIVALIPTDDDLLGVCRPEMLAIGHYAPASDSGVVQAAINNNLHTFVYAGYTAVALVITARLLLRGKPRARPDDATTFWWFVVGGLALAISGSVLLHWHYSWVLDGHALAACVMFLFLGLAAIANCVLGLRRQHTTKWYAAMYGAVGGAMIGAGVLFVLFRDHAKSSFGGHLVLVIEVVEIFLFAVFWTVQTVERWNQTV